MRRASGDDPGTGETLPLWRLLTLFLAAAVILGSVERLQSYVSGERDVTFLHGLVRMMRPWLLLGLLAPGAVWLAARFPLDKARWSRSLPLHTLGAFAFAYGHLALLAASDRIFFETYPPFGDETLDLARFYLIQNLFVYWTLVGATHAWHFYQSLQRRDVDAAELRSMLSEARLDALRHQIQPHFLFNTLNTVAMFARKGDSRAVVSVVADLSGLLRYALRDAASGDVSLREEMAFIEQYVAIERIRFAGRLHVTCDVEPGTESAMLPGLILQPLVENAVRHGLSRIAVHAELRVGCTRQGDRLVLDVEDNGTGISQVWERGNSGGIGLRNVADRLAALYAGAATLDVHPRDGQGTVARITLPFRPAPDREFTATRAV